MTAFAGAPVVPPVLPSGLDTPTLVIDVDVVEANARRLAGALDARGVRLRPHVKTHKSVRLARLQLGAGAKGITVGNLGEAEVMAAGGIDDIFVAYPVWADGPKAGRLRALHDAVRRFAVGVDSIPGAERLAAAVAGTARPLRVLVEIDPGNGRTGVAPNRAADVALTARSLGLSIDGVFAFAGHAYRRREAIAGAASDEMATLAGAAAALRRAGLEAPVVSAGSTPTALLAAGGEVNEIRAGTYLLGDRQLLALGSVRPDGLAAWVAATVVSTSVPGQVVVDAGAKSLTKDQPDYLEGYGLVAAYPDAVIDRLFDYHGIVRLPHAAGPRLGEVVAILPNHACPVVDQFDSFVAIRKGEVVGTWPVDARGRSG
ncbi:MAG TPA: alanine racemase [Candidatus Limnocylindrales bacterium]|jgi:D-serine deaminase-like pyridoxal phosphate-dependent protein|nr:alanine racemase [Candidatus Limnocylindrales bacterium]